VLVTRLLVLLALALASTQAADVSGVWTLEMQWATGGQSTGACTFKQKDGKLTGTCAKKSKITGEVRDRTVTWEVLLDEEGQQGRMTFEGRVDEKGTTIQGKCVVYDGPAGTFTMQRQSAQ
jgi:hypothetical protein